MCRITQFKLSNGRIIIYENSEKEKVISGEMWLQLKRNVHRLLLMSTYDKKFLLEG